MKVLGSTLFVLGVLSLGGCAGTDFGDEGLTYYEPIPYLFVATSTDCETTATVVAIPGRKRSIKVTSGIGSSKLSATFNNGMLASIGQETDAKVPETITSFSSLAKEIVPRLALTRPSAAVAPVPSQCTPTATLYPIGNDGKPNIAAPVGLPVKR